MPEAEPVPSSGTPVAVEPRPPHECRAEESVAECFEPAGREPARRSEQLAAPAAADPLLPRRIPQRRTRMEPGTLHVRGDPRRAPCGDSALRMYGAAAGGRCRTAVSRQPSGPRHCAHVRRWLFRLPDAGVAAAAGVRISGDGVSADAPLRAQPANHERPGVLHAVAAARRRPERAGSARAGRRDVSACDRRLNARPSSRRSGRQ